MFSDFDDSNVAGKARTIKKARRTYAERERTNYTKPVQKRHDIINVVLMLLENRELKVLSKLKDKKIKFGSSIMLIASSK